MEIKKQLEKKWSEITISNNFMFRLVMEDKDSCKGVIERIIGIKIKRTADYMHRLRHRQSAPVAPTY